MYGGWCPPQSSKMWGVVAQSLVDFRRWSHPPLVGLTAKIGACEAGDERGLVSSAVFKTVCGALLRRPGWVRFPSIPAKFGRCDSQADSHSSGRRHALTDGGGSSHDVRPKRWPALAELSRPGPATKVPF